MCTRGEKEFASFCRTNNIELRPIQAGSSKTPDYELSRGGTLVVAEVKDFVDHPHFKLPEPGKFVIGDHEIGDRVHDAVREANRQIKDYLQKTSLSAPAIVVLYNDSIAQSHVNEIDIKAGLFGTVKVRFHPGEGWNDTSHGGKRTLTPEHNTTISAVCVLKQRDVQSPAPGFAVYHNPFAKDRLPKKFFQGIGHVEQFEAVLQGQTFKRWQPF